MNLKSDAKNQHFIAQIEQRLNASNPGAAPDNQRIFSFSVADREHWSVVPDGDRAISIEGNLALYDLFSFDVMSKRTRMNLESLFGQYEVTIETNTRNLVSKLVSGDANLRAEILEIFAAKFLNFVRSPYSVKKILNTFEQLRQYRPTDPTLLRDFNAVLAGKKPQQDYLCSQLEISASEYQFWLATLFMLLMRPKGGGLNLLERVVKDLYESPSHLVSVFVRWYADEHSDKRCLLSDRGYATPITESGHLAFSFNLCSAAFITYIFTDVPTVAPQGTDPRFVEAFKRGRREVTVFPEKNDLIALSNYNRNTVRQCHSRVYCSSNEVYEVRVLPAM
jgi:hypothetical protein